MIHPKFELLLMSGFISTFAAAGGWAMTSKVAGHAAGTACFFVLMAMALPVLALQLLLSHASPKRLIYTIAYHATIACTFTLFSCALLFPAYWIPAVAPGPKIAVSLFIVLLSCWSFGRGLHAFRAVWAARGDALLAKHCRDGVDATAWSKLMLALNPAGGRLLPGLNDLGSALAAIAVFLSWMLGNALKTTFPTASLYAWAPFPAFLIAYFIGAAGIRVGEMMKLREIEAATGTRILPEQGPTRRGRRARR